MSVPKFVAFLPAGKDLFDPRTKQWISGGSDGKTLELPAIQYFLARKEEGLLTDPPPAQQQEDPPPEQGAGG